MRHAGGMFSEDEVALELNESRLRSRNKVKVAAFGGKRKPVLIVSISEFNQITPSHLSHRPDAGSSFREHRSG